EQVREPGRDDRGQAEVSGAARGPELGPARAVGGTQEHPLDAAVAAARDADDPREDGEGGRQADRRAREIRVAQEDRPAGARLLDRARRTHADAEGEAADHRPGLQGADRLALRRYRGRAVVLRAEMFVELLDKLRCPNAHEDSPLVATASRTVDRH